MAWSLTYPFKIEMDSAAADIMSASTTEARAVVSIQFYPGIRENLVLFLEKTLREILGEVSYDATQASKMYRGLPLRHPLLPHLWATDIAKIQGVGLWQEDEAFIGIGRSARTTYTSAEPPAQKFPRYKMYRFEVVFTSPFYVMAENDAAQTSELYRFVERWPQLGMENQVREGNSFFWTPGTPVVAGNPILSGFVKRAPKGVMNYVWRHVPSRGLFGVNGDDWPRNIWNGLGKVNDATFDGCRAGTLLLLPPKFTPEISAGLFWYPLSTRPLTYTVELPLSYFEPPVDPDFVAPGEPYPYNGHNLFPTPDPTTPYWYLATQTGAVNGPRLYQEYDFRKLFRLMGPGD